MKITKKGESVDVPNPSRKWETESCPGSPKDEDDEIRIRRF